MIPPEGYAMGYSGLAAPEERAAPKINAGPEGIRPPEGVLKSEGIGPFTVTVNVWLDVLVMNLVTTTVGRPGVTVTNSEQPSGPVGLSLGDWPVPRKPEG